MFFGLKTNSSAITHISRGRVSFGAGAAHLRGGYRLVRHQ
jgi:hypothetical protein